MSLANLYPQDFDSRDLRDLDKDLRLYIADVRTDDSFSNIATITELSKKNGADEEAYYVSFVLSVVETSNCVAYCYCYS